MNTIYGEWTQCKDCIYFEDCETKEDRDGCYFGETCEEKIKTMNDDKFIRGRRAKTNVYDDWAGENVADMLAQIKPLKYPKDASRECLGFNPNMVIIKSHREGDITVIDEFKFTGVSITED